MGDGEKERLGRSAVSGLDNKGKREAGGICPFF